MRARRTQAVLELVGAVCVAVAAFWLAVPLGLFVVGLVLIVAGNWKVTR